VLTSPYVYIQNFFRLSKSSLYADNLSMKKYSIGLACLGLLLGYIAKTRYWFQNERSVYIPITQEQLHTKNQVQSPNKLAHTKVSTEPNESSHSKDLNNSVAVDLEKLSQSELFDQIYNKKVLTEKENHALYFRMIYSRLHSAYPAFVNSNYRSGYEQEVSNRMGILQAMVKFWPTPKQIDGVDQKAIKQLFYEVAQNKNENLMVRRQAFKNWLHFGNSVSQADKIKLASLGDSRLLHLVSLSDEALIESLTIGDE
jgi:hypothetical protein